MFGGIYGPSLVDYSTMGKTTILISNLFFYTSNVLKFLMSKFESGP